MENTKFLVLMYPKRGDKEEEIYLKRKLSETGIKVRSLTLSSPFGVWKFNLSYGEYGYYDELEELIFNGIEPEEDYYSNYLGCMAEMIILNKDTLKSIPNWISSI